MTGERILVVEDEPKIAAMLKDYLEQSGFTVDCLDRGDKVVATIRSHSPALVLLDLMLPGADGIEVCREIRKFSNLPIIMVTAKVDEVDRLIGLEIGADDYVCKPFSPREVVARVKAVLRRTRPEEVQNRLMVGPIVLDKSTREVTVEKVSIDLTPSEFELLRVMMVHPGRVFSSKRTARPCSRIPVRRVRPNHRQPHQKPAEENQQGSSQERCHSNGLRCRL
jgi:two-component system response regulator BaeR